MTPWVEAKRDLRGHRDLLVRLAHPAQLDLLDRVVLMACRVPLAQLVRKAPSATLDP